VGNCFLNKKHWSIIVSESSDLNRKALPYFFLIILALALVFVRTCRNNNFSTADHGSERDSSGKVVNRNRGFDRRASFLEYTQHARCRMACRQITEEEVKEIMATGKINYRKTDVHDKPCPTYAVEGVTHDNQHVRIVFAQCDYKTKVVTTIDLDKEWSCDCPGD